MQRHCAHRAVGQASQWVPKLLSHLHGPMIPPFVGVVTVGIIFLPCQFVEIVLPFLGHDPVLVILLVKSSKFPSLFPLYEKSLIIDSYRHRNLTEISYINIFIP